MIPFALFIVSLVNAAAIPTFPYIVLFAVIFFFRKNAWPYFFCCLAGALVGSLIAYYAITNHMQFVIEVMPMNMKESVQAAIELLNTENGLIEVFNPEISVAEITYAFGVEQTHFSWPLAAVAVREGISFCVTTLAALLVSWPFDAAWRGIKKSRARKKSAPARKPKAPSKPKQAPAATVTTDKTEKPEVKKPTPEEELATLIKDLRTQRDLIIDVADNALIILTVQRVIAAQIAEKHPKGLKGVQRRLEAAGLQDFRAAEAFLTERMPAVMAHKAVQEIGIPVVQDAMHLIVRYICNDETCREGIAALIDKIISLQEAADPKELQTLEKLDDDVSWIEHQPDIILAGAAFLLFFQSGLAKAMQDVVPHDSDELAQKIKSDVVQDGEIILHQAFEGGPFAFTDEFPEAVEEGIGRLSGYLARNHNLSDLLQMRGLDIEEVMLFFDELGDPDESDPLKLACLPAPAFVFNKALVDLLCEDGTLERATVAKALRAEFKPKSANAISTAFKLIPKEEILGEADGLVAKMGASAALGVAKQVAKSVASKGGDLIFAYVTREVPLDQIHTKMPSIIKLVQRFTGEPEAPKPTPTPEPVMATETMDTAPIEEPKEPVSRIQSVQKFLRPRVSDRNDL